MSSRFSIAAISALVPAQVTPSSSGLGTSSSASRMIASGSLPTANANTLLISPPTASPKPRPGAAPSARSFSSRIAPSGAIISGCVSCSEARRRSAPVISVLPSASSSTTISPGAACVRLRRRVDDVARRRADIERGLRQQVAVRHEDVVGAARGARAAVQQRRAVAVGRLADEADRDGAVGGHRARQTVNGFCFRNDAARPSTNRFGDWLRGMPARMCAWKAL